MLEVLQFVFSSVWIFLGTSILLICTLAFIADGVSNWFTIRHVHNHLPEEKKEPVYGISPMQKVNQGVPLRDALKAYGTRTGRTTSQSPNTEDKPKS